MKSTTVTFPQAFTLLSLLALGASHFVPIPSFFIIASSWLSAVLANRQHLRLLVFLSALIVIPYIACNGPALPLVALWGTMAWVPAWGSVLLLIVIGLWGIVAALPLPDVYNIMPLVFPLISLVLFVFSTFTRVKIPDVYLTKLQKGFQFINFLF